MNAKKYTVRFFDGHYGESEDFPTLAAARKEIRLFIKEQRIRHTRKRGFIKAVHSNGDCIQLRHAIYQTVYAEITGAH